MSGIDREGRGCRECGELISAYLDDELEATELPRLAEHLKACPACGREVDHLQAVKSLLHRSEPYWPVVAPSRGFAARIRHLAAGEPVQRPPAGGLGGRLVTWGSALLAVALLVTGTTLWYRDRNGGVEAPLAQLETTPSQGRDSDDELSDYLRRHALESSRTPFVDYDDAVAFVDYREP